MERGLAWYVMGVLTGLVLAGAVLRIRSQRENQTPAGLATSIDDRLERLEAQVRSA